MKHRMHQVHTENMVGISLIMIKPLSRLSNRTAVSLTVRVRHIIILR